MEHDRILGYFLEEANEHLSTIEQGLRKLPETVRQPTMIRELFRAAHSITGSAAMLGLPEVQQIGNQFEANFKLLKEQPQIEVDRHLQSLFLVSFSFLKAGIERVRQSSDPYHLDPTAADPIGDPVFAQLRAYLQDLLTAANPTVVPVIRERDRTQDPVVETVFREYITHKLDEIIDLCLQPDRPEIRTQIQQICQKLGDLAENFDFLEWTNLCTACRLAIANPANFLPQLGQSMSIAVKQAQIPIVAHRHQDIGIAPALETSIDCQNGIFSGDLVAGNNIVQASSQKLPDLLSINDRLEPINFDLPDNLAGLFAIPNVEFVPDAIEELNSSKPELAISDAPTPPTSISWLNSSVEQDRVDDFDDLQLDILSDSQLVGDLSSGDDFAGLDINPLGISSARINPTVGEDFTELEFSSGSNDSEIGALDNDLTDLEFSFSSNDLNLGSTVDRDLIDLDFSSFGTNDLGLGAIYGNLAELDLNLLGISDREINSSLDCNLEELDLNPSNSDLKSLLDRNGELNPNPLNTSNLDVSFSFKCDLLGLDLNPSGIGDLEFNLAIDGELGELELNPLDISELDALLGVASGADATLTGAGLEFDDLDALMTAVPTTELAANLEDILREPSLTETASRSVETLPSVNPPVPNTAQKSPERRAKQSRTFEQTMRVSVRHLNNLSNLVGELVVSRNTLEQDQNRMRQFVEKLLSEVQKLNEVGKRMQDLYERSLMEHALVASRQQSKPALNPQLGSEDVAATSTSIEYDPLEMDRFTPIHLLSQKMIELTVRVRESTADIEFVVDGSTEVTRTLRQITGQLQEDLTKSRMLTFAQTADRLQRGVRDNGLKYGKQIELSVEGRDTLIDKVILESLADPLIHMVNNAIAHGIESTETRLAVGKSSEGKITIRAIHQGNQTIISISDDGAGIDTERVKAKAIEKGIITAQQAATMSKTEAYDLLFLPSFSTKDRADELSGRGVGMDVVRTSITEIRGTITTESRLGVGTTFTIRLPLALSIAKALIAVNNKRNIAFPMDGIEDTQDVSPEKIQLNSEGKQCIFWRDELMPFMPLSDLLGFNRPLARNNFDNTNEDDSDLVSILILRSDGNLTAVQVDKITGEQEIVIKPLQGPASKPLGIAGATVMGDGRIIPIVDVMELIALAQGTLSRQVSNEWASQMTIPTVEVRESTVLIVDDSITVRELISLTFKRAGYRVEQARDGQEAWDKLRAGLPCDIVFCDIEMPRMDGLEFLSRIQKDPALIKIPIAMLTSRGSDRHRQIASQLGASGYFIKPYLEEALLDAAKRMIEGEVLAIV